MAKDERTKEYMIREMEMTQRVIDRLALNSFAVKGWAVTLVVGILLFRGPAHQVWIAFLPILVFWYLDAYFLWLERMYRTLFEWIRDNRSKTDEHLFDMNPHRFEKAVPSKLRTAFSTTLVCLYGTMAIVTILYLSFLLLLHAGDC
jgi:hypothetical protein